jgi:hypothetical protein
MLPLRYLLNRLGRTQNESQLQKMRAYGIGLRHFWVPLDAPRKFDDAG